MTFRTLLRACALAASVAALAACTAPAGHSTAGTASAGTVAFQQIRNATVKVGYAGTTFLVDPILAPKDAYPGIPGTYNSERRNPTVDLPVPAGEVIKADAVIITHLHPDHWDDVAKQMVPKSMPIFVQDANDAAAVRKDGFTDVRVLDENTMFNGTRLIKTGGQHGDDKTMAAIGNLMGHVSGIVFQRPGYKTVYIAGDTVWNRQVESALAAHRPDVVVLNTGYARVLGLEGSIIMGKEDLYRAHQARPDATIVGVHMEAFNHMMQSRQELKTYIAEKGMDPKQVLVPADGESYRF